MDIIEELRLKSQIFSLESQLGQEPSNLDIRRSIQVLEDKILQTENDKSNCTYFANCKPKNRISLLVFNKPWNRLRKELQADRLYVYCQNMDLNQIQKKKLYKLFKQDLEDKILTKKDAVEYDIANQEIVTVSKINIYLENL